MPKDAKRRQTRELGAHTITEILSQAQCWETCINRLESDTTIGQIAERFANTPEWIFVGCGSSYYLALSAAANWSVITGTRAHAVPASEVLFFPGLVFAGASQFVAVLISRSGETSEVLRAAQFFDKKQIPTIAVSCAVDSKLATMAPISLLVPDADEQSVVMTRSFTSMLLALQYLAGSLAGKNELLQSLKTLPSSAEKILRELPSRVRQFVNEHQFSNYVYLGQGPYFGLASEAALKVMEMSRSFAQSFHTLEFRHGPKATVGRGTLITFLLSETKYDAQVELLEEMKALGATTMVVARTMSNRAQAASDLTLVIDCSETELSCLPLFVLVGQLTGFYLAVKNGLDPDRPQNLSRVVLLEELYEQPQNA